MMEVLSFFPLISEPLLPGVLGVALTLVGSLLQAGPQSAPRRVGSCFCVCGLMLMLVGFFCITSNTSLLAYAQRV